MDPLKQKFIEKASAPPYGNEGFIEGERFTKSR